MATFNSIKFRPKPANYRWQLLAPPVSITPCSIQYCWIKFCLCQLVGCRMRVSFSNIRWSPCLYSLPSLGSAGWHLLHLQTAPQVERTFVCDEHVGSVFRDQSTSAPTLPSKLLTIVTPLCRRIHCRLHTGHIITVEHDTSTERIMLQLEFWTHRSWWSRGSEHTHYNKPHHGFHFIVSYCIALSVAKPIRSFIMILCWDKPVETKSNIVGTEATETYRRHGSSMVTKNTKFDRGQWIN